MLIRVFLGSYHPPVGSKYRVRRIHIFRGVLPPSFCVDLLLRPRDQGTHAGADGSRFQGQLKRRRTGASACD